MNKLTVLEKIGFGAGDMAVNVVISSMFLIITYFYTDVFGLEPADLAVLFIAVRGFDAIADPAMGFITDRITTRWGRTSSSSRYRSASPCFSPSARPTSHTAQSSCTRTSHSDS